MAVEIEDLIRPRGGGGIDPERVKIRARAFQGSGIYDLDRARKIQPQRLPLKYYGGHVPTAKQMAFLLLDDLGIKDALYGGAAGGGKSDALLMSALRYVEVPSYSAILLRRSYVDLRKRGSLMQRASQWLTPTDARWSAQDRMWWFPSGASLEFGYLADDDDLENYQSAEYQFVGIDEESQFTRYQSRGMFARLRRLLDSPIPVRKRGATNPGGVGHEFLKELYVDPKTRGRRAFIPATMDDNPHLDRATYEESLQELDPVRRAQLRYGDWNVRPGPRKYFRREWFILADRVPQRWIKIIRAWDIAATAEEEGDDPDWTAGVLLGLDEGGQVWILDVARIRANPGEMEQFIGSIARQDLVKYGLRIKQSMEQEPGASGKITASNFVRRVFAGIPTITVPAQGDKYDRMKPLSAANFNHNLILALGDWNADFIAEGEGIPEGSHDDMLDAASQGYNVMMGLIKTEGGGYW